MNNDPTALYITATSKIFRERQAIKSLDQIAELCSLARLGNPMNGSHYAALKPKKKWMLKIFFASSEDLMDFEHLILLKGYLANVEKHSKDVERVTH